MESPGGRKAGGRTEVGHAWPSEHPRTGARICSSLTEEMNTTGLTAKTKAPNRTARRELTGELEMDGLTWGGGSHGQKNSPSQ